jgi:hypothetical protein
VSFADLAYLAGGVAAAPWLAYKVATDVRFRDRLGERFGRNAARRREGDEGRRRGDRPAEPARRRRSP